MSGLQGVCVCGVGCGVVWREEGTDGHLRMRSTNGGEGWTGPTRYDENKGEGNVRRK